MTYHLVDLLDFVQWLDHDSLANDRHATVVGGGFGSFVDSFVPLVPSNSYEASDDLSRQPGKRP